MEVPLSETLVAQSQPYVGQWNRLVSTTNWEKGRIIAIWRDKLAAEGLPPAEFSDEAWGRLVGGVTGQHVGRLRRAWQRFGNVQTGYKGLFWSHFQAALDWNDAEMWLEGAVQNGWSVAQMREQRWETLGKVAADQPRPEDVVSSETDEDFEPARTKEPLAHAITGQVEDVQGPRHEGPDFGDDAPTTTGQPGVAWDMPSAESAGAPVELVKPFENLPDLPDDLAEAFDAMKLAILRHKTDGWQKVSAADATRALDALKALVLAPSDETAPFLPRALVDDRLRASLSLTAESS